MNKYQLLLALNKLDHWLVEGGETGLRGLEEGLTALHNKIRDEPDSLGEAVSQLYRYVQVGPSEVRLDSVFFTNRTFGLEAGETRKVRVVIYGVDE